MKNLSIIAGAGALAMLVNLPALAQLAPRSNGGRDVVVQNQPNTTGNDRDVVISRGATGAETATTDSAAGGNSNQPSRSVPNGSAGGGSGGNGGL